MARPDRYLRRHRQDEAGSLPEIKATEAATTQGGGRAGIGVNDGGGKNGLEPLFILAHVGFSRWLSLMLLATALMFCCWRG